MLTIAKVVMTVAVLGIGVVPMRADLNRTHATNPLWTAHARYHVVWQVLSYVGLAILALGLMWVPGSHERARVDVAAAMAARASARMIQVPMTMRLCLVVQRASLSIGSGSGRSGWSWVALVLSWASNAIRL